MREIPVINNVVEHVNDYDGFAKYVGLKILETYDGYAKSELILDERHFNPIGSIHGGVIFTLADTVSGAAVYAMGKDCTTLSANISYLRAAMQGKSHVLYANAEPVRLGRHICVMEVVITDEHDTVIAKVTVEFYILGEHAV